MSSETKQQSDVSESIRNVKDHIKTKYKKHDVINGLCDRYDSVGASVLYDDKTQGKKLIKISFK